MFDVSWGELALVTGIGLAVIGRKDLPRAANVAGTQLGRIVGLLQGARARADRFAAQSELKQLQNELRSGLRELDAVKSELAVSMSGSGMMGRSLGAVTANVNMQKQLPPPASTPRFQTDNLNQIAVTSAPSPVPGEPPSYAASQRPITSTLHQTTAAVAEQQWAAQGIAFQSAAERGAGLAGSYFNKEQSGSAILSNIMQQSLIFDQYDRVVAEQDAALQSKVNAIQEKHAKKLDAKREEKKET